jgi:hypothetical protein
MTVKTCRVSFVDRGKTQSIEVLAETAYEAAVLGLHGFSKIRYIKGPRSNATITIEVIESRSLTLRAGDVWKWLYDTSPTSAEQRERKKRLKNIVASGQH